MPDKNEMDITKILELLSEPRLSPYRAQTASAPEALELYTWIHRMASTCFELIAYLEVGVRNSIDKALREYHEQSPSSVPWIFSQPLINHHIAEMIATGRNRLPEVHQNNRDQISASLSFGFWSGLLGSKYDELWKKCLHKAFPYAYQGKRKSVAVELEAVRKFRNRIAHHDSLLNTDILFEVTRIFKLAGYIDPQFENWMRSVSRVHAIYAEKPVSSEDTVVVAGKDAWPLYCDHHIYVCQAGRSFKDVNYMAFYSEKEIKPEIARIKFKRDDVLWTEEHAEQLMASNNRNERKLGNAIMAARAAGWEGGRYQVFILSSPNEKPPHGEHRTLNHPIKHERHGRGSAYTQSQRYTSLHALELAQTTDDL